MNPYRKTTVAGMFYERDANDLRDRINWCFSHEMGPGYIAKEERNEDGILGIIVPHAGLVCSGPFAAYSYNSLIETGFPDVCILIGPNHNGIGPPVAIESKGEWETPFGSLQIDEEIGNKLTSSVIKNDPIILHQQENSLEVQLPFIKYLSEKVKKECSIVPLVINQQDKQTSTHIGEQLEKIIENEERKIAIIASTDFSHEGYSYGRFPPDGLTSDAFARKQDDMAIQKILKKDATGLYQIIQSNNISMCGYGGVIALLTVAQSIEESSVELLKYGTSYDTCSDSDSCVGYGAFAVKKNKK